MLGLYAIFSIGGLILILIGFTRSDKSERSKAGVPLNRIAAGVGPVLFFLALALFSESYLKLKLRLESAQATLAAIRTSMPSTQTVSSSLPTQTPVIQTPIPTVGRNAIEITTTPQPSFGDVVSIEALGAFIYDLNGRESGKGSSNSDLNIYIYDGVPYPFYNFRYTTTKDQSYTSLTFFFWEKFDLTLYSAVQFTIQFQDQLTLCYFSIAGTQDIKSILLGEGVHYTDNLTIHTDETTRGREYTFTIPVHPVLEQIGPSETIYIQFYSNRTLSEEFRDDSYTVSNIKFIR